MHLLRPGEASQVLDAKGGASLGLEVRKATKDMMEVFSMKGMFVLEATYIIYILYFHFICISIVAAQ